MAVCVRCWVSGRVQGVWYRAATQQQARDLGLTGYARNLPDGRVEVLACGSEQGITTLKEWLWVGPPGARVSAVECQPASSPDYGGFGTY